MAQSWWQNAIEGAGTGGAAGGWVGAGVGLGAGLLSNLFGGGGGDQPWSPRGNNWSNYYDYGHNIRQNLDSSRSLLQNTSGQYSQQMQRALSGNMGMSPDILNAMFGRGQQNLQPQFNMQQDTLRSGMNPRLAGSGAASSAMAQLLGQQGATLGGMQTDVNIYDAQARQQAMMQAFGQLGQRESSAQQAQSAASNAWGNWLGV